VADIDELGPFGSMSVLFMRSDLPFGTAP
jgi:hypothetical protein